MGGQPLRLGPFVGGLNTISDPTAIADTELAEMVNFELEIDGSMKSRPPFKELVGHPDMTERIVFFCEAIFSGNHYLIGSNSNGVFYLLNGVLTKITGTFQAGAAVQYADKVYLISKPGSADGGKWDPTNGFVAVAAIPKGQACVIHKERLYITPGVDSTTNTSRLKFSEPGDFENWPANNFIDISQGDGTKLIDLTVYQDNLLLFKQHSSYLLGYDVRPTDATLKQISPTIGVLKQHSLVNYENQVFLIDHTGWVYEIINNDFNRINIKCPFIRDNTSPSPFSEEDIFLSLLEDRLICRYYKNIYVYGLKTRTWSQWKSERDILHFFGPILTIRTSTGNQYFSGSCLLADTTIKQFVDKSESSTEESFYVRDTFTGRTVSNGWDESDSGHIWTTSGGNNSDYSVSNGEGLVSLGSVNVSRRTTISGHSKSNFKVSGKVKSSVLATGGSIFVALRGRSIDNSNEYLARLALNTDQTITLTIRKIVAGVESQIGTFTTALTHVANTYIGLTFEGVGTQLRARSWLSVSEPTSWDLTVSDSALSSVGSIGTRSILSSSNTNTLPVVVTWDNISETHNLVSTDIECETRTKNFDMAISHQFKRLWWWGADVITTRDVYGVATPIASNFAVTWDDLENYTWDDLFTWDNPLTAPTLVDTTLSTGVGSTRLFVKFNKGLRYRQISFYIKLVTIGSSHAKLFTLTALTEAKQVVGKAVS